MKAGDRPPRAVACCQALGPLWEGAPPAGGGGESLLKSEMFRAVARFSPSGPTGHLPRRGRQAATAILLTEYATERRKAGMSLTSAALSAAKARLRPILMTALTMIFGLFPLMVASGVGANGNSSLGTGTVGGMVIGTLALLFIVPSLFIVFQYLQEKVRPIQFQPAADWQIQEECVEAKEERQHHIESKNEEKK